MSLAERILKHSEPIPEAGCWIWTGVTGNSGYGRVWHKGRFELAHRASYLAFAGEIHGGAYVLHRCDVKLCVNPAHLFTGSQSDNLNDCVRKGRYIAPRTKLSAQDVTKVIARREAGETFTAIARDYEVTPQAIFHRWKTWKQRR